MRTAIRIVAALALAGLTGAAAAQEPKVLNVYNWNDYIAPEALRRFERETGIRVNYDLYDSNETLDAKLRAGRSGYDLVSPTAAPFLAYQIEAGLYQQLDRTKLSNYGELDPEVMAAMSPLDAGNRHAVPWMWGTSGIGYNVAAVKAAYPDAPVDSLRMVFDPEVVSKFQACGVIILDSPIDVIPAALRYLGLDPNSHRTDDLEKAAAMMGKIRRFVRKFNSSEYINELANGDACVVYGYSGDIIQAGRRAAEAKRGITVAYAIPREGGLQWIDAMAIPKGARHPGNAHLFLDFMMRPEIAAMNSNFIGYANGVRTSVPLLDPAIRDNPNIYPSDAVRQNLYVTTPPPRAYERTRTRARTRIVSGR